MQEVCFNFSLRKASRVLNKIYDRHLEILGIKCSQFSILRIIGYLGQTTSLKLVDVMKIDQTTLSRNLKPLLRDGYIAVTPGQDRRYKLLSLTPAGKRLLKKATSVWSQAQDEVRESLSKDELDQLVLVSGQVANLDD